MPAGIPVKNENWKDKGDCAIFITEKKFNQDYDYERLASELKELNNYLNNRKLSRGSWLERRQMASRMGIFSSLRRLTKREIKAFFGGASLAGVDGSFNTFGASFPYLLTIFRALARMSRKGRNGDRIWAHQVFSPLLPKYQNYIDKMFQAGLDTDEAMARLRWEILAVLEAQVGNEALEKGDLRLLLWDGGFGRLAAHAGSLWETIKALAIKKGVLLLGVTEEIATCALAGCISQCEQDFQGITGDREILFGLLKPGEVLKIKNQGKNWGRIYVRFSNHPQVIAVDYLLEQEYELETALNFLYTITPFTEGVFLFGWI